MKRTVVRAQLQEIENRLKYLERRLKADDILNLAYDSDLLHILQAVETLREETGTTTQVRSKE